MAACVDGVSEKASDHGERLGDHLRDPHEQAQGEAAAKAQVEQAEAHHSEQSHQLGMNWKD
jgi:hypothetical protein